MFHKIRQLYRQHGSRYARSLSDQTRNWYRRRGRRYARFMYKEIRFWGPIIAPVAGTIIAAMLKHGGGE